MEFHQPWEELTWDIQAGVEEVDKNLRGQSFFLCPGQLKLKDQFLVQCFDDGVMKG